MVFRLLVPELRSLQNQLRRSSPQELLKIRAFGAGALLFWLALFAFCWYALKVFLGVEIFGAYLVKKLLSLLLLALFTMSCFSNLINALSAFYLSEDLPLVHSLPVSLRTVHLARFVQTFLASSWMMVIFGLPVFLAYGAVYRAGPLYYLAMLAFLIPYLVIPTGVGVTLATLLVNIFPARRTRELMVMVSFLFVVGLFLLLRFLQPEKLVNAENFSDVMVFLGQLQAPSAPYLPGHWGTEVLFPLLTGDQGEPLFWLGLTILSGAAAVVFSTWTSLALYPAGWNRAQQASAAVDRRPGLGDALLRLSLRPLPSDMRALIIKDLKTFFRDAAEWPQLFLILALVAVYLYSVKVLPLEGPFITLRIHNIISFLNLAMVGFVVSAISVRFLFTSVSAEGRAFWMLRAAPMSAMRFLLAKYLAGLPLLLVLGLFLVVVSNLLLKVQPLLMGVGVVTMMGLSFSLAGLSVGIGAMYPNFKAENVAKVAAGPGGILFMIASQIFVAGVLLLEAIPVIVIVRAEYQKRPMLGWEWAVLALGVLAVLAVTVAGAILPLRRGARALEQLN